MSLKILWLCKRRPQGRDLLRAPYGRFFHLPRLLADRGHAVTVALLSHARLPSETLAQGGVRWTSDDAFAGTAYFRRIRQLIREDRPDWILGASDTYFGILAAHYGARTGVRCAIDAYDNFESYVPWAFPLHALWRRALRRAALVSAAGPQLAERLAATGGRSGVQVLPMAADPQFRPLDRGECRKQLGLDPRVRYVGVGGSLDPRRGAHVLFDALDRLRARDQGVVLLVSGRNAERFRGHPGVHALGLLADDAMPAFVNCLDVACVIVSDNAFGRYSYPAKLAEAIACGVPVVASATAPIRWILQDRREFLAPVGDARTLADRIAANLTLGRVSYPATGGWPERAAELEAWLQRPLELPRPGARVLS